MSEPNGSVHSFDRRWTSIAEDAFLTSPHTFETLAPVDISLLTIIPTLQQTAPVSASNSKLLSEALQPDSGSFFGFDAGYSEGRVISCGWNFDNGPLNHKAKTPVDYNFDRNFHSDHHSPATSSSSEKPCTTPHSHSPLTRATSPTEKSSLPGTSSPSLSLPFPPYHSPSQASLLGPRTNCAPRNGMLPADGLQTEHLPLQRAQYLRCPTCSRTFTSRARLV